MTELKIILVIALAAAVIIGCTEDNGPTVEEKFMSQLVGQWTLSGGSVQLDDMDVAGAFAAFALNVNADKHYSTTAPVDPIWLEHGTFTLIKNNAGLFNFLRNDGVLIEVTALTDHLLEFNQQHESPSGRTNSIDGRYYFSLTK
jgi:hypothetical protein